MKVIASMFSSLLDCIIGPKKEVVITTGANEGILYALMAFVELGDEVIILELYFN